MAVEAKSPFPGKSDSKFAAAPAVVGAILLALLVGVLAIDAQSFWIDELATWRITQAPGWKAWLSQLLHWPNSDSQLVLYHLYTRLWSLLGPTTELVWRWSNVPWLALLLWPLLRAPVARDVRSMLWVMAAVYALHPMTWYYVNELRPYAALTAGSTLAGVGVFSLAFPSVDPFDVRRGKQYLIVGAALMAALSPLGAIWAGGFVAAAAWLTWRTGTLRGTFDRHNWFVLAICSVLLLPIFYHYTATFVAGVSATTLYPHRAANFGFAFYELAGVSGLGPGREQLRVSGPAALSSYVLPLGVACAVLGAVAFCGLRALAHQRGADMLVALALMCLPLVALYVLGSERSWRVVGRHMLPMLFVVNACLAWGFVALRRSPRGLSRTVAIVGLLMLTSSAVSIRHGERHHREMYARAAAAAEAALRAGGTVWWVADPSGIRFYAPSIRLKPSCVPESAQDGPGQLVALENPVAADLEGCQRPAVAIFARREAHDRSGAGVNHLTAAGLRPVERFNGFEIWR